MHSRATFHMNRMQTLLLPLDANECKSCLMTPVKAVAIPRGRVLDCEKKCKRYLNPSH